MLNIAICDDDKTQIKLLSGIISPKLQLRAIPYQISTFTSGHELITSISSNSFDIIFLDIEMPGINGITTAQRLRDKNAKTLVIFITSYPDFVFQGYEVHAYNYLLKPYKPEKLLSVLYTALDELDACKEQYYLIEQRSESIKLPLSTTYYFTSEKRMLLAITDTDSHSFYGKLDDLEEKLPDFFIRIHQRYLVNIYKVSSVTEEGVHIGDHILPVSRAHKQELMIAFAKNLLH